MGYYTRFYGFEMKWTPEAVEQGKNTITLDDFITIGKSFLVAMTENLSHINPSEEESHYSQFSNIEEQLTKDWKTYEKTNRINLSALSDLIDSYIDDVYKWYDAVDFFVDLSAHFPHIVFSILGDGEEYGDNWKIYAKNGQTQCVEGVMVYPEPNPYFDSVE